MEIMCINDQTAYKKEVEKSFCAPMKDSFSDEASSLRTAPVVTAKYSIVKTQLRKEQLDQLRPYRQWHIFRTSHDVIFAKRQRRLYNWKDCYAQSNRLNAVAPHRLVLIRSGGQHRHTCLEHTFSLYENVFGKDENAKIEKTRRF